MSELGRRGGFPRADFGGSEHQRRRLSCHPSGLVLASPGWPGGYTDRNKASGLNREYCHGPGCRPAHDWGGGRSAYLTPGRTTAGPRRPGRRFRPSASPGYRHLGKGGREGAGHGSLLDLDSRLADARPLWSPGCFILQQLRVTVCQPR